MEPESRGSGKLVMVIAGIALVLAALVVLFLYPGVLTHQRPTAPVSSAGTELKLLVEPSGTDLLLTWNKNSPAVINATHGVLSINDGDRHENYDMDGKQLQTGSIVYTPVTGDVSFNMEVTGPNHSKTVTESVRSLRTRPSPMPETGKPSTAATAAPKPAQPGTTPAETAAAAPAEAAPVVPAKAAPKAFSAPLAQRLRPASPDEIASLGAEPGAPAAGVNVNPNLSVPSFGSAPVPVAPAPAAQPKRASGGRVAPAQLTYRRDPEYPTAARQLGAHGVVVLDATIGKDGKVTAVKVISGHPLLVNAAKAAVMQWHYKPTLLDGQPVENTDRISLIFGAAR
jgi:protein TonB